MHFSLPNAYLGASYLQNRMNGNLCGGEERG